MSTVEEIREQLGDQPTLVTRSYSEFRGLCRALGLSPNTTSSALNVYRLRGSRPTAIVLSTCWERGYNPGDVDFVRDFVRRVTHTSAPVLYIDCRDF